MKVADLTNEQLSALIANHQKQGAFDRPLYAEALDELQRRDGPGLDLEVTIKCILGAAAVGSFLSYGDVAKANGCEWNKVRRQIPRHLDRVLAKAHARKAPLITSIVVNDKNRETGDLEESSLNGFVAGAERLGIMVEDPVEFLRREQEATFLFAERHGTL
ncbi:hypothetical protein [Caulobacter flavus]|uniref:hypothetical protein n=1 Tax=Caulobacter flavus TaxID=1679497 RepID=UPI0011AF6B5F|nr:hypothetical protein [Caulobacter flavus]